jgi:hypothetical protein
VPDLTTEVALQQDMIHRLAPLITEDASVRLLQAMSKSPFVELSNLLVICTRPCVRVMTEHDFFKTNSEE